MCLQCCVKGKTIYFLWLIVSVLPNHFMLLYLHLSFQSFCLSELIIFNFMLQIQHLTFLPFFIFLNRTRKYFEPETVIRHAMYSHVYLSNVFFSLKRAKCNKQLRRSCTFQKFGTYFLKNWHIINIHT